MTVLYAIVLCMVIMTVNHGCVAERMLAFMFMVTETMMLVRILMAHTFTIVVVRTIQ